MKSKKALGPAGARMVKTLGDWLSGRKATKAERGRGSPALGPKSWEASALKEALREERAKGFARQALWKKAGLGPAGARFSREDAGRVARALREKGAAGSGKGARLGLSPAEFANAMAPWRRGASETDQERAEEVSSRIEPAGGGEDGPAGALGAPLDQEGQELPIHEPVPKRKILGKRAG